MTPFVRCKMQFWLPLATIIKWENCYTPCSNIFTYHFQKYLHLSSKSIYTPCPQIFKHLVKNVYISCKTLLHIMSKSIYTSCPKIFTHHVQKYLHTVFKHIYTSFQQIFTHHFQKDYTSCPNKVLATTYNGHADGAHATKN